MPKIKIEFNEYSYDCSDGCCNNYGTITVVDGVELPFHNQDLPTVVEQILQHLGYDVEIKVTYNAED